MKTKFFTRLVSISTVLFSITAQSQSDNTGYAVTDSIRGGIKWNFLRSVDIKTGSYSDTLVRLLKDNEMLPNNGVTPWNGVAAIAYDKKSKKVYFTSLLIDKLSYVDLKNMTVLVAINNFSGLMPKQIDQSNIFTRMVIADDGFGYAITNDANHLVRFTTGNSHGATDLGALIDAPGNEGHSVHNGCSSWGGDIIADDEGNLYLFTFRNEVFKINIQSRVAAYIGTVTGLPVNFSTSGVAVDKQGNDYYFILASSVDSSSAYKVKFGSLQATVINQNNGKNTADLCNSAILKIHPQQAIVKTVTGIDDLSIGRIKVFPNPVISEEFTIQFSDLTKGKYTIEMIDAKGQTVVSKVTNLIESNSKFNFQFNGIVAKGVFIIRITDNMRNVIFTEKIIVQ